MFPFLKKLPEMTEIPMERCLLTIHLPSLGALHGGRRGHQTHVHGRRSRLLPLRWDLLSQGRGLFQQTLPEKPPGDPVHRPTSSL